MLIKMINLWIKKKQENKNSSHLKSRKRKNKNNKKIRKQVLRKKAIKQNKNKLKI